jgi:hypothetical protein
MVPVPSIHTEVAINGYFIEPKFVVDFMQLGMSKVSIFLAFLQRPTIDPKYILPLNACGGARLILRGIL